MRALLLLLALLFPPPDTDLQSTGVPYNDAPFRLPWAAGVDRRVVQGNMSVAGSHQGVEAYAWDVSMPIGSVLLADRDGYISMTKDDSNVGGFDYYLGTAANYVVINHGNGTQTVYLHLMYHGVLVRPGQRVVQGQPVAYSGDTGFAGGPHLHFAVEVASTSERVTQSVPVRFSDVRSWGGLPLAGRHYVSGNQQAEPAPYREPVPSVRRPSTSRSFLGQYQNSEDYPVPHGHFYMQTRGNAANARSGFLVADDDDMPFNQTMESLGGPTVVGYPISQRFVFAGLTTQAFQKMVLQWHPESGQIQPLNVLDLLHDAGQDAILEASRQIPPQMDMSGDTGLPWNQVVERHQAYLTVNDAIKSAYFATPDSLSVYGLPVSPITDEGNAFVVRCQRAVFQQWKVDVPWAAAGQVTIANGGDIARETGMFPEDFLAPDFAPIP